ncbi:MAG: glycosyltransferase [Planctomycetes bacterium]|nr:glycosyltransferase [Planctomycetota bacterium]
MIATALPRLRVLHVLHSLDTGGAERIVCDLARRRAAELISGAVCLDRLGSLAATAREAGMALFCTHRREGLDLRQIGRLASVIRRFEPDVIHAHQYTPYFYAALAASAAGAGRIVFTEHGRHWPDRVSPSRQAINQVLRLRRDRITAVCRFAADALRRTERLAGRDVRIIPNGVCCDLYDRPRRRDWLAAQLGVAEPGLVCLQVGRFHPVKDHATGLRAFARVRAAHPEARLVLVGDGPQRPAIEDLVRALDLADAVHLLGERPDVSDLLAAADVFVLSSLSEAASLSILEAMSAALPVAATDVGGNREIVLDGRTGLLSPRANPCALAASLGRLLADADLRRRMGQAGRRRARAMFDQARMHDDFVALYRQMTGGAA